MAFTGQERFRGGVTDTCIGHIFERICKFNGVDKRHTKPYHPWTNGMAEHEPDHQGIHDKGVRVRGTRAATGACPGLRSKLQLRQTLEGAQVEDTIPGDLRGMGKRSKPL